MSDTILRELLENSTIGFKGEIKLADKIAEYRDLVSMWRSAGYEVKKIVNGQIFIEKVKR